MPAKKTTLTPTTQHTERTTMKNAVTVQQDFFSEAHSNNQLFSVRAGVPLNDAIRQFEIIFSSAQAAVEDIAATLEAGGKPQSHYSAKYLLEMAGAVAASIHAGHEAFEKEVNHDAGL